MFIQLLIYKEKSGITQSRKGNLCKCYPQSKFVLIETTLDQHNSYKINTKNVAIDAVDTRRILQFIYYTVDVQKSRFDIKIDYILVRWDKQNQRRFA